MGSAPCGTALCLPRLSPLSPSRLLLRRLQRVGRAWRTWPEVHCRARARAGGGGCRRRADRPRDDGVVGVVLWEVRRLLGEAGRGRRWHGDAPSSARRPLGFVLSSVRMRMSATWGPGALDVEGQGAG